MEAIDRLSENRPKVKFKPVVCTGGHDGMRIKRLPPFKLFFLLPTIVTTWFHQRKGGWKT
jgi:hypothetical protein